jgi:hypothetical protein
MRHTILLLFIFSSISLFAQETISNHHLTFRTEIGGGYSIWQSKTPDGNFKGHGPNFNLNLTPYYNYKNFMVGISYGYELVLIDTLINTSNDFPYGTGFKNNYVSFNKVSFAVGYNLIQSEKIIIGATVRFGTYRLDKSFDNKLIKNKLITDAGLDLSYILSDRIALLIQPNFGYKYYKLNEDLIGGAKINHRIISFNCLMGLNLKIV